jgi:uncharacterized protein with PIN domain
MKVLCHVCKTVFEVDNDVVGPAVPTEVIVHCGKVAVCPSCGYKYMTGRILRVVEEVSNAEGNT